MRKWAGIAAVFFCCAVPLYTAGTDAAGVAAFLTAVSAVALCERFDRAVFPTCAVYLLLCLIWQPFLAMLPVIAYCLAGRPKWWARLCWMIPLIFFAKDNLYLYATIAGICTLALFLRLAADSESEARRKHLTFQDASEAKEESLQRANSELLEGQEMEVRLATLEERGRIAREIHDNVGHLLTRSILQVGALQISRKNDEELQPPLLSIKETLTDAMDSVRSSVHDLHDEAIDLRTQLETLAKEFAFCPVILRYDAGEFSPGKRSREIKHCLLAVTKEALSNIARHSNATSAEVSLAEYPGFYQLIIKDNGTKKAATTGEGIGLRGIADRVAALGGVFRAEPPEPGRQGFRVFISIPI